MLEVAEVPKLDTLAKRATTRHHIPVVVTDIDSVAADRDLAFDLSSHHFIRVTSSDVPEAYQAIPATRKEQV
jgi:hypothetical protein